MRTSFGLAMICGAVLSGCGQEKAANRDTTARLTVPAPDTTMARRKILFAGTSLTAGLGLDQDSAYSYLVQRKIDSAGLPFETVNAGVSGETTAGLLERLDWLLRGGFDVVGLGTGGDDAAAAGGAAA